MQRKFIRWRLRETFGDRTDKKQTKKQDNMNKRIDVYATRKAFVALLMFFAVALCQAQVYCGEHKNDYYYFCNDSDTGAYSFLVGSDSHLAEDTGRLAEMMQMGLDNNDILCAHLGDIADTKAEYYILLSKLLDSYNEKYRAKQREKDGIVLKHLPFIVLPSKYTCRRR